MPASMGHGKCNSIGNPLHRPSGCLLHCDSANLHSFALQKPGIYAGDGHPWCSNAGHCNPSGSCWKGMCDWRPLSTPTKGAPWYDDQHVLYHPRHSGSMQHDEGHETRWSSGGYTLQPMYDQLVKELSHMPCTAMSHSLVGRWSPCSGLHCGRPHSGWRIHRCDVCGWLCHACTCSHQPTHWGSHQSPCHLFWSGSPVQRVAG